MNATTFPFSQVLLVLCQNEFLKKIKNSFQLSPSVLDTPTSSLLEDEDDDNDDYVVVAVVDSFFHIPRIS